MVIQQSKCATGDAVTFEETPYYFKLTIGIKTWYWDKDTGKYDGISVRVVD